MHVRSQIAPTIAPTACFLHARSCCGTVVLLGIVHLAVCVRCVVVLLGLVPSLVRLMAKSNVLKAELTGSHKMENTTNQLCLCLKPKMPDVRARTCVCLLICVW